MAAMAQVWVWMGDGYNIFFAQLPQEILLKETWFVARIVGAFAILAVYAWALFQKGHGNETRDFFRSAALGIAPWFV